tara:strand:+ start:211 stop:510 length:300 start_codon:yes stop_codon:yes gene_type:complete
MAKTKKKEKIVDLKTKPEKITKEELKKVQDLINAINRSQMDLGQMETRKHAILHQISLLQEQIGEMRDGFEKEYGTADVNIHDGIINYTKENGEVNKED